MAFVYVDTSALIKRYVVERGRREVLQLLTNNHCVVSAILPIEVRSALRRRAAEGALDERQISTILKRFNADRAFWTFVDISKEVVAFAETLSAAHPVRALDAIHVASAHLFASRIGSAAFTFVSADTRQTAAAAASGMTTRLIA